MKSFRNLAIVALAVAGLAAAPSAKADPTETLNMTFLSGATFSGTVTFAPDYSYPEAVNGTLYGYQYGTEGYVSGDSDAIDWVYDEYNYATPATPGEIEGNYLMDGPPDDYNDYYYSIDFTYDYTNIPMPRRWSSITTQVTLTAALMCRTGSNSGTIPLSTQW